MKIFNFRTQLRQLKNFFIFKDVLVNSKEPSVLREHNLNFDKLCKLEKSSNGAEILVCGGQPSYLSKKTILTQNKFTVSEL